MKRSYQKQMHRKTNQGVRRGSAVPEQAVQLTLDRSEVLREMQEGLHRLGVSLGLELAALMMEDEVERLCGSRYEHEPQRQATRHGRQRGVITIAGQKIGIERPRVRSTSKHREVPLEVYGLARREEAMPSAVLARMVRGVSCRDYEGVIESAAEGFGVKRSSVSRSFATASAKKIAELRERRLDDVRFPVVFIDGIGWADTTMVVALGLSEDGTKRVLGFREGATENSEVSNVARGTRRARTRHQPEHVVRDRRRQGTAQSDHQGVVQPLVRRPATEHLRSPHSWRRRREVAFPRRRRRARKRRACRHRLGQR